MIASTLLPARGFDEACEVVLDYLVAACPMGLWAVTRIAGDTQRMVKVRASGYPMAAGTQLPFETSFCRPMAEGLAPQIATNVTEVPAYRAAAAAADRLGFHVGSYVGIPIARPDGELFGTVCGFSPEADNDALSHMQPLLGVLSTLLAAVLEADEIAATAARKADSYRTDADVDALTGLLNRRGWDRYVAQEEHRQQRFGGPASVVMLDLDRLKDVNDRLGHAAGDAHIHAAAVALKSVVRDADVLARLGGDEFAVLAIGADERQVQVLVQRMRRALEQAGIEGSFGYAPYTVVAGFPGALAAADAAMYHVKKQRRSARP